MITAEQAFETATSTNKSRGGIEAEIQERARDGYFNLLVYKPIPTDDLARLKDGGFAVIKRGDNPLWYKIDWAWSSKEDLENFFTGNETKDEVFEKLKNSEAIHLTEDKTITHPIGSTKKGWDHSASIMVDNSGKESRKLRLECMRMATAGGFSAERAVEYANKYYEFITQENK